MKFAPFLTELGLRSITNRQNPANTQVARGGVCIVRFLENDARYTLLEAIIT